MAEGIKVNSLARGVKGRRSRVKKVIGDEFTADGIGSKRMPKMQVVAGIQQVESKREMRKVEQYKKFETYTLISSMVKDEERTLKSFFERTKPRL
ncbi:hypothetical protein MKX01_011968, partial [Papaver californicum]